nr:hypothetical protein [uncultured Romboutsia sp.]
MKNIVIKGDYKNYYLSMHKDIDKLILEGINDNIEISKNIICDYNIKYIDFKRDIIDIVVRIIIGVFLIGPMGVLSGFIANKNFISYRLISIEFKNGNKSLVKIDNRTFKYFVQKVY